jgi:hypothetical protein
MAREFHPARADRTAGGVGLTTSQTPPRSPASSGTPTASSATRKINPKVAPSRQNCGATLFIALAGAYHSEMIFGVSAFWLLLVVASFFSDGGSAVVGPYAAEVWPSHLRTAGMGSAYGFGGIGKIIGPPGLALVVGSANVVKP